MSTAKFKLVDEQNGKEKAFDSRSAAEQKKEELDGLGDYRIEPVKEHGNGNGNGNSHTTKNGDATETADAPAESDGGVEVVEPTPEQNGDVAPTHDAEAAGLVDATDSAGITDDPLDYMPSHFVDEIQGVPTINRKGYAVLAEHYGISVVAEPVTRASETEWEYAEFHAVATARSGAEYSGFGSAHVDRMDGDDQYLLNELAETRAMKRCVAWATGVGMTAIEEMEGSL